MANRLKQSSIDQQLEANFEEVVEWRRYLHQHPEVSYHETETAKFIAEKLRSFGYEEIHTGVGGHGIVTKLTGTEDGPTVALRADFDALPITDEKEVAYRSQNPGVMHACGHDGHTSALLGTAKALRGHQDKLKGTVVFIFQPAEEIPPGGAQAMIKDGALDGVDYIYGAHLDSSVPVGQISLGEGFKMAAVDKFSITIKGKGGHGAAPHKAIDPIVVGSDVVSALQKIVSRRINPLDSAVITLGVFQSGNTFNVIPDTATLEGTVRSFDPDVRQTIKKQIHNIVDRVTAGFEAGHQIDYLHGYPALYNQPEETEKLHDIFSRSFGEENLVELPTGMGAEDFSYYLKEKPGNFFKVGSQNDDEATQFAHHHPRFDIDERALLQIEKAFVSILDSILGKQGEV
ncbi:amidohydrolase [Halobacillus locisalis]|uniref:Amidohydrolase n=1 Tax=Halobacillus locisalis TaxID=220753 RepID=A0A838CST8_9BACI|nr:amidohydrolase [Halobacillus locisalis]MBA2174825.1 amidohydrolase [Halobacillus locisalis]